MKAIYLIFWFSIFLADKTFAQTIERDVIGSAGTYVYTPQGSMAWTIGEVSIHTYSSSANFFTQGFHQPSLLFIMPISDFFIPEGFSPNDDVINDFFVIRGLEKYPNNSIVVFNRWGNKVFEAQPYTNNWDGKSHFGLQIGSGTLPISTYFYILDLGDGSKKIKGTIYLNR